MAHFVLAMSFYKTKQVATANSELSLGQALIHQYCPNAKDNISMSGMAPATSVYWYDWVIAQILQREADAMIQRATDKVTGEFPTTLHRKARFLPPKAFGAFGRTGIMRFRGQRPNFGSRR